MHQSHTNIEIIYPHLVNFFEHGAEFGFEEALVGGHGQLGGRRLDHLQGQGVNVQRAWFNKQYRIFINVIQF